MKAKSYLNYDIVHYIWACMQYLEEIYCDKTLIAF